MKLSGLHILMTYRCNYECDHCFVWGSPDQDGTLSLAQLRSILDQAVETVTIEWIYFEGGEPFLYYAALRRAVEMAVERGFKVGIVTNAYWAVEAEDAEEWLRPFAGKVQDLSVSSDPFHGSDSESRYAANARAAAERLRIPLGVIRVSAPGETGSPQVIGQLPAGESALMFRGRAAATLAGNVPGLPWDSFAECPHEDLREPGRVHLDPFGNVHLCQGIRLGNVFRTPLREICESYEPNGHPIAAALLSGGPSELSRRFGTGQAGGYADACHLCDSTRRSLRSRFPEILGPDQMYGVPGGERLPE